MSRFNIPAYNPEPIESPQNALMRGMEMQRAQQGNALQNMQMQAFMQRQQQEQQQAQRAQADQGLMSRLLGMPVEGQMPQGMQGPGAPMRNQGVDPLTFLRQGGSMAGLPGVLGLNQALAPQARKVHNVGAGGRLLSDDGSVIADAQFKPPEPDKTPEALRTLEAIYGKGTPEFQQAARMLASKMTTHAPAASAISYGSPVPFALPDGGTGYVQPGNKPGAAPQVMTDPGGKPLQKPAEADNKALTEGQAKAVAFSARMESADKVLATLSRKGVLTTIPGGMGNNAVGSTITAMSTAEQQQLGQAKRNFVNALLRRESGAVIGADEFANADRQYFPQVGDSRPVIEQKARERRVAIEGMRADVPKGKQGDVDRISGGDAQADPLGLRSK
jgi:hypothetical protein